MIKFFIDIFCKDTIVGLCQFEDIKTRKRYSYQKKTSPLFKQREESKVKYDNYFIGPMAYHL